MKFHFQIDTNIHQVGDFKIEAQEFEIKENIPNIPANLLVNMRCPAHKFSMTCDFFWKKVSMILSKFYYSSTFPFILVLMNIIVVNDYFLGS